MAPRDHPNLAEIGTATAVLYLFWIWIVCGAWVVFDLPGWLPFVAWLSLLPLSVMLFNSTMGLILLGAELLSVCAAYLLCESNYIDRTLEGLLGPTLSGLSGVWVCCGVWSLVALRRIGTLLEAGVVCCVGATLWLMLLPPVEPFTRNTPLEKYIDICSIIAGESCFSAGVVLSLLGVVQPYLRSALTP
jgi:hypothetical protein